MKYFDVYGIECSDLDVCKDIIEENIGVKMEGRDSDYLGEYYTFKIDSDRSIQLIENIDHYDGTDDEILEPDFPAFRFIIRIDGFSCAEIEQYKISLTKDTRIHFLRSTAL